MHVRGGGGGGGSERKGREEGGALSPLSFRTLARLSAYPFVYAMLSRAKNMKRGE